jgi:hypothetical protein
MCSTQEESEYHISFLQPLRPLTSLLQKANGNIPEINKEITDLKKKLAARESEYGMYL